MDVESLLVYPEALEPETLVGGWRILGRSGRGGFGAVYRVEDAARPGEVYALKLALRLGDPRAERETALLMTKASHPNVVRFHACGRWPHPKKGYHYIVMDYVEGPNLIDWVEGSNPTFQQLSAVFDKLALALSFLHGQSAWHRDIKPENIHVRSRDGEPILLDLSVGDYEGADTLTDQPLPPGTLHCRSPESLRFNRRNWGRKGVHYEHKPTDDLYALGVTAYRVLTGHWPFPPDMERELLEDAILWRVPPSPDIVNPRVPAELAALVMRLLDKNPVARPQSGQELHEALVAASAFGKAAAWENTCFEWETELDGKPRRICRPDPPRTPLPASLPEPPRPVHFAPVKAPAPSGDSDARDAIPVGPSPGRAVPTHAVPPESAGVPGRAWRRGTRLVGLLLLLGVGLALTVVRFYPTSQVGSSSSERTTHEVANGAESFEARQAAAPPQAEPTPAVVAAPATCSEESTPVKTKKTTGEQPAKQRKSNTLKKAATAAACLELGIACTGPQVKPFEEVEKCPPEALATMAHLGLKFRSGGSIVVDINQPGTQSEVGRYQDGSVTSVLVFAESGRLPPGTLLMGTLWTSSGRKSSSGLGKTYGRYTEARTPDGHRYPICFILGNDDGALQLEGSQPGAVLHPRALPFTVVRRFIFE
jgi:serine/threonine protein kinase